MIGFKCDRCGKETETEDDHIVTDDGDYVCLKCFKKLQKLEGKE